MTRRSYVIGDPTETGRQVAHASELVRAGEFREAEKILAKLSKISPNNADVLGLRGTLKVQTGNFSKALLLLKRAVRLDDKNPSIHGSLGVAYEALAKPKKAKIHYQRSLKLDPSQARMHVNFGALLWREGKHETAVTHYETAIKRDSSFVGAYVYMSQAMYSLRRIGEAIRFGESAIKLDSSSATAHLSLGRALRSVGRTEEAVSHFWQAIKLNERLSEAYKNYAYSGSASANDAFIDKLFKALAWKDWTEGKRAHLYYAAGKVKYDCGDHQSAFEHWKIGARLKRRTITYTVDDSRKTFAQIQKTFDASLFERRLHKQSVGPKPIFVVGMPRSGTTLVEQILAGHPHVAGMGELPHIRDIAREMSAHNSAGFPKFFRSLEQADLIYAAKQYVDRLGCTGDKPYISDKMPTNFLYLGFISLLFPHARIVHCRRSALDTCLSCFITDFTEGQEWSYDLSELGTYYAIYLQLMDHWRRVLPLEIYELDYEAVIADLEGEAHRLLAFCSLDLHPRCLEFYRTERPVFTASDVQVRKPLYDSSVGRWRQFEQNLQPLIENLPPQAIS